MGLPVPLLAALFSIVSGVAATIGVAGEAASQLARKTEPIWLLPPEQLVVAYIRQEITPEEYLDAMARHGIHQSRALVMAANARQQPDSLLLITSYRRKLISQDEFARRMRHLGWEETDLAYLLKATEFYPTPQDLISWQSKEVYEPPQIAKYGLEEELDAVQREPFYKGGLNDEQIRNYWIAHWDHPSWTQVQRFRHYGQIDESFTEQDVYEWFKLVEIPPYWRNKFIQTLYDPLTRVDVRRMWDLNVISDEEVVNAYLKLGYNKEDANNLLIFTKLERRMPELRERYKNGWINDEDLRAELRAIGLKESRIEPVAQRLQKADRPGVMQKERDLTKADIVKAAKRRTVSVQQAMLMLVDLGYNSDEARLLLEIERLDVGNSAENPMELTSLVQQWRRAAGLSSYEVPDRLLELEQDARQKRERYQQALEADASQDELVTLDKAADIAEYQLSQERSRWEATLPPAK